MESTEIIKQLTKGGMVLQIARNGSRHEITLINNDRTMICSGESIDSALLSAIGMITMCYNGVGKVIGNVSN